MGRLNGCGKKLNKKSFNCIHKFVKTKNHTTFILMNVPHRYDLEQTSFINKEVNKYYRRLQKHMKVFKNIQVIKANLDRRGFTKHSQHMNAKVKELMAKE